MKITFSPLVAGASGRAADAVASSWKGRAYIRKYVIPHNPQSAAQVLVRNSMASCVTMWRSLSSDLKACLDTYGVGYRMSGYNVFTSKNRAKFQATDPLAVMPANPNVAAISDFLGTLGDTEIVVTWTDPVNAAFTKLAMMLHRTDLSIFEGEILTTLSSAETYTFTGLTNGKTYDLYAFLYSATPAIPGTTMYTQGLIPAA